MGVHVIGVRDLAALEAVDALVIPGGESTTIGMLMERFGLLDRIRTRIAQGFPVYGSCAGAILLAREIVGSDQPRIGAMDMSVRRNAYGRQVESFEADVLPVALATSGATGTDALRSNAPDGDDWPGGPFRGVFIRAPQIMNIEGGVRPLLVYEDRPVLVRSERLLASTFHPELTDDDRIHRYFVERVAEL